MRATVVLLIGVLLFAYGCSGDTTAKKMAFVQRGDAYFADGKYAEAILEFKNAIQLDPEDAQAFYKLGLALLKRGSGPSDLQEAFHSISKSVKFDATNLEAQLKLGEFFLLSRKFDKAQEKAELVLACEPNNLAAHLLLGHAYGGQQQFDKAIAAFQTALTLDPKRLQTYFNLATQYQLHRSRKLPNTPTVRHAHRPQCDHHLSHPWGLLCRPGSVSKGRRVLQEGYRAAT